MSLALVTPSYAPDLERAELLVESVARCVPEDIRHYLVVDRVDLPLFRPLASSRTILLAVEDVLPSWIYREPGHRDTWISRRSPPIYNWVIQQLVKLSIFGVIQEDVAVFCDSDNTFIRPFDPRQRLYKDGRLGLLRVAQTWPELDGWRQVAGHLLGLNASALPPDNYIGNLIAWRREVVTALQQRIEACGRRPWLEAVTQHAYLSEYVLYGVFVDHVLGLAAAGHIQNNEPLIHAVWDQSVGTLEALDQFLAERQPGHVGLMIYSKSPLPVSAYRERIRALFPAAPPRVEPALAPRRPPV